MKVFLNVLEAVFRGLQVECERNVLPIVLGNHGRLYLSIIHRYIVIHFANSNTRFGQNQCLVQLQIFSRGHATLHLAVSVGP